MNDPNQGYSAYPPPPNPTMPPAGGATPPFQTFINHAQAVVTKPNVATFDMAQPFANWNNILIALGALGVARGVFGMIHLTRINGFVYNPIGDLLGGIIGTFIGFFIGVGILYLIARAFGGVGSFLNYSHVIALVAVPLGIVSAVVSWIPVLGGLAALALGIYEIYLLILGTSSTHRLDMGKSSIVVLIPVAIGVLLGLCVAALALFANIALFSLQR